MLLYRSTIRILLIATSAMKNRRGFMARLRPDSKKFFKISFYEKCVNYKCL